MSCKRADKEHGNICDLAHQRVIAVVDCIDVLLSGIAAKKEEADRP